MKIRLDDWIRLCYTTIPVRKKWTIFVKYGLDKVFRIDYEQFKKNSVRRQILKKLKL